MADVKFENVKSLFVHKTTHGRVTFRILKSGPRYLVGLHRNYDPKDNQGTKENKGVYFPLFAWKRFLEIIPELDESVQELTNEEQEATNQAHSQALSQIQNRVANSREATSTPTKETKARAVTAVAPQTVPTLEDAVEYIKKTCEQANLPLPQLPPWLQVPTQQVPQAPLRRQLKRKSPLSGTSPLYSLSLSLSTYVLLFKQTLSIFPAYAAHFR